MATYSYTDPKTGFVYSYNEAETTDKDRVRGLLGDIVGTPIWYISDASIAATLANTSDNGGFWEAVAQCAEKCSARLLSMRQEVQEGDERVKNFDVLMASKTFLDMAANFRNNQQPTADQPKNPGAIAGKLDAPCYSPYGPRHHDHPVVQDPAFTID